MAYGYLWHVLEIQTQWNFPWVDDPFAHLPREYVGPSRLLGHVAVNGLWRLPWSMELSIGHHWASAHEPCQKHLVIKCHQSFTSSDEFRMAFQNGCVFFSIQSENLLSPTSVNQHGWQQMSIQGHDVLHLPINQKNRSQKNHMIFTFPSYHFLEDN